MASSFAEEALAANQQYTFHLEQQLAVLRDELLRNLEKQRLLRSAERTAMWKSFSSGRRCIATRRQKLWDSPYFIYVVAKIRSIKCNEFSVSEPSAEHENPDIVLWRKRSSISVHHGVDVKDEFVDRAPVFHRSRTVSKSEKNIIISSVRSEYIDSAKKRVMAAANAVGDGENDGMERQNDLRLKLMNLEQCSPIEIDSTVLDWDRISVSMHSTKSALSDDIEMVKYREIGEYKKIWNNYIRCDHSKWSMAEKQCLDDTVREHGGFDWMSIHCQFSTEMGGANKRSVLSLLAFYQQTLNVIHTKHDWTRNDDEILISIAKILGENDFLSHSYYLDRRLPHQCAVRLQLASGNGSGGDSDWTTRNDLVLVLLMMQIHSLRLNGQWAVAAKFVGENKTEQKCKQRFAHFLQNTLSRDGPLDLRQCLFIIELLRTNGSNLWAKWTDISFVINLNETAFWSKQCDAVLSTMKTPKKRKRKEVKSENADFMAMKRDKVERHKYVDPAVIARTLCILFGGKSGLKLFRNDVYPQKLQRLLLDLKAEAIRLQKRIFAQSNDPQNIMMPEQAEMERVQEMKREITVLVDHPLFDFDALIANVVTETVYFESDIDAVKSYLYFDKH